MVAVGKESIFTVGDLASVLGLGRSPGGGHENPPQLSCLENPMDGGAWWATVYRVTESDMIELAHMTKHTVLYLNIKKYLNKKRKTSHIVTDVFTILVSLLICIHTYFQMLFLSIWKSVADQFFCTLKKKKKHFDLVFKIFF